MNALIKTHKGTDTSSGLGRFSFSFDRSISNQEGTALATFLRSLISNSQKRIQTDRSKSKGRRSINLKLKDHPEIAVLNERRLARYLDPEKTTMQLTRAGFDAIRVHFGAIERLSFEQAQR